MKSTSKRKIIQWTPDMETVFLEEVLKAYKNGYNSVKRIDIGIVRQVIEEKCGVHLELAQLRNHLQVWKARFVALRKLHAEKGLGWCERTSMFHNTPEWWASYISKHKEAQYWQLHQVTTLHKEVAAILMHKDTHGDNNFEGSGQQSDDTQPIFALKSSQPLEIVSKEMDSGTQFLPSPQEVEGMDTSANPSTCKKDKIVADHEDNDIKKELLAVLKSLAEKLDDVNLCTRINNAVEALEGFDDVFQLKLMLYFANNRDKGACFLGMNMSRRNSYAMALKPYLDQQDIV